MVKIKPSPASKLNKRKSAVSSKGNTLGIKKQPDKIQRRRRVIKKKTKRDPKGVVYISHIPHGFYEEEIKGYFSQFGKVTGVNVPRGKSGRSKGYAFIEYKYAEIAEIAAETMNNYLMLNRLLKAKYIPPDQQKPYIFLKVKEAQENKDTLAKKRELAIKHNRKLKNRPLKLSLEVKRIKNLLKKKNLLEKRMKALGVEPENLSVEDGNFQLVLERKKELDALKKIKVEIKEEEADDSEEDFSLSDDSEAFQLDDSLSEDSDGEQDSEGESKSKSIAKSLAAAKKILKSGKKEKADKLLKVKSSKKSSLLEDKKTTKNSSPTGKKARKSLNKTVQSLTEKTPSLKKKKKDVKETRTARKSNVSHILKEVGIKESSKSVKARKKSTTVTPKETSTVQVSSKKKISSKKSAKKDVILPKVSSPSVKLQKEKKLRHRNLEKVL